MFRLTHCDDRRTAGLLDCELRVEKLETAELRSYQAVRSRRPAPGRARLAETRDFGNLKTDSACRRPPAPAARLTSAVAVVTVLTGPGITVASVEREGRSGPGTVTCAAPGPDRPVIQGPGTPSPEPGAS